MKWQASVILFAIVVSIAAPPSLSFSTTHDKQTAIGTLDVCHSAAPALFSSSDMPGISMHPLLHRYFALSAIAGDHDPLARPFLIVFRDERPPDHLL
jgi:hypothetical protein